MRLFTQISHVSITVTDLAKTREFSVKDPDGNMVEFLGPSKSAGPRRMES